MENQLKYHSKYRAAKLENALRVLPNYENCQIDFISNDYLGMGRMNFGPSSTKHFSGLGSRLIAGNSREALYCEDFLAELFQAESALVFNSGFDANLGFFSTIPQKDEIVLYDQAIHASIRDGLRLSAASNYAFQHNDLHDLSQKLERFSGKNIFIVVEGIYSMDGDSAPLSEILILAQKFGAYVVVDEAHSLSIHGETGLGLSEQYAHHPNLLARIITFGKAVGAHGAAVLCNREMNQFLVHACRSFIYTTALAPKAYLRIVNCLNHLSKHQELRSQLNNAIEVYAEHFNAPKQHIQILPMRGIEQIKALTAKAVQEKIAIKGVWSPTVPEGQERLRISLHSYNTEAELMALKGIITEFLSHA